MAKRVSMDDVVEGKRSRNQTDNYIATAAEKVRRQRAKIIIPRTSFRPNHWAHQSPAAITAPPPAAIPVAIPVAAPPSKEVQARQLRRLRNAAEIRTDVKARIEALEASANKVQLEFETSFDWEERKLIAAQAYYSERLSIARVSGSLAQTASSAVSVAARASHTSFRTAQSWMQDHINNDSIFSASNWGCFPKLASVVFDIDTQHWAREWVVSNMGHRLGKKNKVFRDFHGALHGHLALEYNPKNPTITEKAGRKLASKEYGWCRLKSHVKPYVDGTLTTLRSLIAYGLQKIGQRERLLDNARTRKTMAAYRLLALHGGLSPHGQDATRNVMGTGKVVEMWEREHSNHRDIHRGELAALYEAANIFVPEQDAKIMVKMKSRDEMKGKEDLFVKRMDKKWRHIRKKFQNNKYKTPETKQKTALRTQINKQRVLSGVKETFRHTIAKKRL